MSYFLTGTADELRLSFLLLVTPPDVASMLDIEYNDLIYYLYRAPDEKRYTTFQIKKKNGQNRQIASPSSSMKILQQKLLQVLSAVYHPKKCVHGFVKKYPDETATQNVKPNDDNQEKQYVVRNVKTNANKHKKQRFVLNIDIKDFFPSINFGRVRGMFMAKPYSCTQGVATVLAQICCFNNQLPQGAPTSPIISNMICAKMDSQLQQLAQKTKCFYTRYADDITFSTSLPEFPQELACLDIAGKLQIGEELRAVIGNNGFEINQTKTRLQAFYHRQEVTGITVNQFPNITRRFVQEIRAMLNDWHKSGYDAAQERHWAIRKNTTHRHPDLESPSFANVIKGKIVYLRMVRYQDNKEDSLYTKLLGKYLALYRRDFVNHSAQSGSPDGGRVFISYARNDEKFAQKIYQQLLVVKENVWLDTIDIIGGTSWSDAIEKGLDVCDVMYLVVSPRSMKSENVAHEWQYFQDEGKIIIPIILEWAKIPFQLRRIQYIDFRSPKPFDRQFTELRNATYQRRKKMKDGPEENSTA